MCFTNYTKCRSTFLIWIWILPFCLCNSKFFLALHFGHYLPIDIILLVLIVLWSSLLAWDVHWYVTIWIFCSPFSPYSVLLRQGTYLETNAYTGRIVLHLKSVTQQCLATRFSDSQGQNTEWWIFWQPSTLPTIFHLQDHIWNQSYWLQQIFCKRIKASLFLQEEDKGILEALCKGVEKT